MVTDSIKSQKPRHYVALIILASLIFLTLSVVFILDYINRQSEGVIQIIRQNFSIYVSGIVALFIIIFYIFFWAYRKIIPLLSLFLAVLASGSYTLLSNAEQEINQFQYLETDYPQIKSRLETLQMVQHQQYDSLLQEYAKFTSTNSDSLAFYKEANDLLRNQIEMYHQALQFRPSDSIQ